MKKTWHCLLRWSRWYLCKFVTLCRWDVIIRGGFQSLLKSKRTATLTFPRFLAEFYWGIMHHLGSKLVDYFCCYAWYPEGRTCLKMGSLSFLRGMPGGQSLSENGLAFLFTRDALRAYRVYKWARFLFFNAGCPEGIPCLKMGSEFFFPSS